MQHNRRLWEIKRFLPMGLAVVLLAAAVTLCSVLGPGMALQTEEEIEPDSSQSVTPHQEEEPATSGPGAEGVALEGEMRAVWVPFMSLNMQGTDYSEEAFREKFDAIIAGAKQAGANTLVVHVRPFGDALYPSSYFPWSHLVTGEQGKDPGYDPLAYMVEATHQAGMQFHAWVNPLRIQISGSPQQLSAENPYQQWRGDSEQENDLWVLDYGEDKYYNPAVPQVRELIINGVKEIVENYAVDAIHFDDYFYPTTDSTFDSASYNEYCAQLGEGETPLAQSDWRTANINALISGVYGAVHSAQAKNAQVQFGISPQGNTGNCLAMGADVYAWGSVAGYVDYLCPQIYVNFDHPLLPFDQMAQEWKSLVTNEKVKLYLGLALYKAGSDVDEGTWQLSDDIIRREVEYGRQMGCDGFMLYSYDYLDNEQTKKEMENLLTIWGQTS